MTDLEFIKKRIIDMGYEYTEDNNPSPEKITRIKQSIEKRRKIESLVKERYSISSKTGI